MADPTIIARFEKMISDVLSDFPELFVIKLKVKPTNNLKLYLDGDQGLSIDNCVRISRKLRRAIEEESLFPEDDFSLEVSSPGIEEPLSHPRQYAKNVGRQVELVLLDESVHLGRLVEASDTDLLLETTTGKGKKAETKQTRFPLSNIKTTTVQVTF